MLDPIASDRLRRQLRDIPVLAMTARRMLAHLPDSRPRQLRSGRGGTGGRLPCREDVLTLLGPGASGTVRDADGDQCGPRPLMSVLNAWCELAAGTTAANPHSACLLLLRHHRRLTTEDFAADLAAEIDELHRGLRRLAGPPAHRPAAGRCPRCGLLTQIVSETGAVRCGNTDCAAPLAPLRPHVQR